MAIREVAPGPCVIVGHSFGGRVAVCLAAQAPELVTGLVLTGVPLLRLEPRARPKIPYRAGCGLHRKGLLSDQRMENLRNRYGSSDYKNASPVMRAVLVQLVQESYVDELQQLHCPIELVWGANDRDVPVSIAEAAHAIAPTSTLTIIANAGHHLPLTDPLSIRSACERILETGAAI